MLTLAYLAPLLLVVLLLASGRVGALAAGGAGLLATVAAAAVSPVAGTLGRGISMFGPRNVPPQAHELLVAAWLGREAVVGAWLAWIVIAVVLGGLFFWRCLEAVREARPIDIADVAPAAQPADGATLHRQMWFACFLLGPFTESVTGFGVGCVIAVAYLLRLGIGGLPALLLALNSQILVPWGALAVGTLLGAALATVPVQDLGYGSAVLQAPILLLYLVLFWHFAARAGSRASPAQKLDDLLWIVALAALLVAANLLLDVEIAGAAALGLLLVVRWLRDRRPDRVAMVATLRNIWPYALLVGMLLLSRTVPPLRAALGAFAIDAFAGQPVYAPLYNPGSFLLLSGAIVLATAARPWAAARRALRGTAAMAWRPLLVTLLFVVMARLYGGSGMAAALADALYQVAGRAGVLASPLLAGVGGFLTASNAGSNAMLMPLQAALAQQVQVDTFWLAAIQNSVGSNLTLLSPVRVAMGAALLAGAVREADVYRQGWIMALPAFAVGIVGAAVLLLV